FKHEVNTLEGSWPTGMRYLYFERVQPGGVLAEAGAKPYDIVMDKWDLTGFFRRLEKARGGGPIPITVASRAGPGPVSQRPTRQILVRVPAKNYSLELERDLGFRCALEYIKDAGQCVAVLTVRDLKRGKPFDQAGFRDRDVILAEGGVPHFFEK